jgi:hypothetical protein
LGEVLQHPQGRTQGETGERKGQGKKLSTARDIYQLLVGEIGIPRREFLYDIRFWEVRRIIRGYRRRDLLKLQLIAECVYAATFAMRDPNGKTVADMFPMLFEDDGDEEPPITAEDVAELQAEMDAINSQTYKKETE